ncbi:Uncharacterised protein [Mycobacteroides abscessus subsp. abscessus]|nr:Uncharacterised protein [Mycobacteroides abscessus subsp. abscessus]
MSREALNRARAALPVRASSGVVCSIAQRPETASCAAGASSAGAAV